MSPVEHSLFLYLFDSIRAAPHKLGALLTLARRMNIAHSDRGKAYIERLARCSVVDVLTEVDSIRKEMI